MPQIACVLTVAEGTSSIAPHETEYLEVPRATTHPKAALCCHDAQDSPISPYRCICPYLAEHIETQEVTVLLLPYVDIAFFSKLQKFTSRNKSHEVAKGCVAYQFRHFANSMQKQLDAAKP